MLQRLLLLLFVTASMSSCFSKLGAQFPPLNTRKLKKKVKPTHDFNHLIFAYRSSNGYWPKSERDVIQAGRTAVADLESRGFNSWTLGEFSHDSLYIHFVHDPVFQNAHIGGVPIPGREVRVKTLYVHSTGIVKTSKDK